MDKIFNNNFYNSKIKINFNLLTISHVYKFNMLNPLVPSLQNLKFKQILWNFKNKI